MIYRALSLVIAVITSVTVTGTTERNERNDMECNCNLHHRLAGDGCEACNPALALEIARETIEDPFDRLVIPQCGYSTIVADPPWKYGKWGKASIAPRGSSYEPNDSAMPYQTMKIDEIAALPVGEIAAADCDLYLWTTQKYLPAAFDVLKAWGFRYCQTLTWCKKPKGTGQGGLYCPTTEFCLLGRKGRMPKGKKRIDTTWWEVKRPMRHSQKPEHFQDIIELQSDGPRIELFARRHRPGWDVWGNEV